MADQAKTQEEEDSSRLELERELDLRLRLLDRVPGMVGYWDAELRNRYANRAYVEWFGADPNAIRGRHIREVIGEELFRLNEPFMRAALGGTPQLFERVIVDASGVNRCSQARYTPDVRPEGVLGFFVLVTDITALRDAQAALEAARLELETRVAERTLQLTRVNAELTAEVEERRRAQDRLLESEERLRQSQKMEAIGSLAGGIAHDFNNLLSVIVGHTMLLLDNLDTGGQGRGDLSEVLHAANRATALTRQLLAFSRRQVLRPAVVDLNQLLVAMSSMIERLVGEDVIVTLVPGTDLGRVKVDPGQVEQVVMNLVVNARDAMPRGGQLTIETTNVMMVNEPHGQLQRDVQAGPYVRLSVTDTGHGMDRAMQARIFEPFFTTKEPGRGTGLGLSTVFGIVKQSQGNIYVYSEPGQGTTFKIYLPRVDEPLEIAEPTSRAALARRGTETILLVEDDDQVRNVVQQILIRGGYQVFVAASGANALLLVERRGPVDLLLTDVVMPGMSGRELADRLTAAHSRVKVLFMSGYTDHTVVNHGVLEAGVEFVQKPIEPASLLEKVRLVLQGN